MCPSSTTRCKRIARLRVRRLNLTPFPGSQRIAQLDDDIRELKLPLRGVVPGVSDVGAGFEDAARHVGDVTQGVGDVVFRVADVMLGVGDVVHHIADVMLRVSDVVLRRKKGRRQNSSHSPLSSP